MGALVACNGGSNDGYACMDDADCSGGLRGLAPQSGYEGDNDGMVCTIGGVYSLDS